jgi:hypothetical protein
MYLYRKTLKIPNGKRLYLIPLGDIQDEGELDRLDDLVKWSLDHEKRGDLVRLFGTGDYFETFSPSERVKKAAANFHETTLESIDRGIKAQADDYIRRLKPMRGKIFFKLQGHHWDNVKVGNGMMSSDQYIAESLNAEFAGDGTVHMELLVNGFPFKSFGMHGYGSARTGGAKLNKRLRLREVVPDANWYWMGHDNSKIIDTQEPLVVRNGKQEYLKQYISGVGCLQRAYFENKLQTGYAERLALAPASIGFVVCMINVEERKGERRLNYHVSA